VSLITIDSLTKKYGSLVAVENFNLTVDRSQIVALVGPDGAGKTSIFRSICGLITYDSGAITIDGYDVAREFNQVKHLLGYMPQSFSLYPDLTVEENLSFYAGLFGLGHDRLDEKKKLLYEFSGLGPFHDRRAGALSGGMKQKLALSCALVHDPEVLVLDEPTTGVDPLSRRQFWDILKDLRRSGSAILVSTPYMDEVALSDKALFIYDGRKLAEGTPGELTAKFKGRVYRAKATPTYACMQQIRQIEGLDSRRFGSTIHIYTPYDRPIEHFSDRLSQIGITSNLIEPILPELEDTFIQLMSG
jgi:drug efflux transport system ATP-binding protein